MRPRLPALLVLATLALCAACPTPSPSLSPQQPPQHDDQALADVLRAIAERSRLVTDYRYEGKAVAVASGKAVSFSYQMKQPRLLRADLEELDTSFIFDGARLSIVDRGEQRVLRHDLSKGDESVLVAALHDVFGDYACEGFKAPVTSERPEQNRAHVEEREGERFWVLSTPVDDEVLQEVRYVLRMPGADFVEKAWVIKDGRVYASTRVLEEHKDEKTGLSFPRAWEHISQDRHHRVELSQLSVNEGLAADAFEVKVPEGFALTDS